VEKRQIDRVHNSRLNPDILERIKERRGTSRLFEELNPARTAHVVVDLQNGFMEPGAPAEVPAARAIVPNVNRICDSVRSAGGINVFLRFTHDPHEPVRWDVFHAMFPGIAGDAFRSKFVSGHHYWRLHDGLDRTSADPTIDKTRFSAFTPGTCTLGRLLLDAGIDTIIVTGTLTNCCCESTARDAMQLNYRVVFVEDANAALTDESHNATLNNMAALFADVTSTTDVVDRLTRAAGRPKGS
jgi:ureidoacrylate peracid hydrolase